ncbi:hypothetical protein SFRURICE_018266, partial [Spodoptera frugiperda]
FSHSLILKVRGGGTHIFPLWKRLTFKRLILTKSGFRNLNVFFKDLSIDTHHGYLNSFFISAKLYAPINMIDRSQTHPQQRSITHLRWQNTLNLKILCSDNLVQSSYVHVLPTLLGSFYDFVLKPIALRTRLSNH